ncbi:MAG: sterol desaturase family protein [Alcanivoracaceae bacterium]|jgi:sterol desaturase/sphingolipid hydroxylase (fatty acid hydroxylase superfamily)|nr:sterol desaturase family protein [Alcanivoracaceae bacterium]
MSELELLQHEPDIRLFFFIGTLLLMTGWESVQPRRQQSYSRRQRWPNNLLLVAINTLVVRMVFPLAAVGIALMAAERSWGLFNQVSLPGWLEILLSFVLLDVLIYFQHRVFHRLPWLWRLHRMHHADLEFDVTTGLRFHPLEILISMLIKVGAVLLLGAPAIAVLAFEVVLNATALFNHGNVRIPAGVDRVIRLFIVTPDMHRVHHSIIKQETNSNYGFNVPWWDRLFRTYRAEPAAGQEGMTIGIEDFRTAEDLRIDRMLVQPFRSASASEEV